MMKAGETPASLLVMLQMDLVTCEFGSDHDIPVRMRKLGRMGFVAKPSGSGHPSSKDEDIIRVQ